MKMNQQKQWTKQTTTEKLGYYVAPEFYNQLLRGKEKVIKGNLDRVYVIDGREGEAGKSTLAMQLAYVVDPTITLDNVVFRSEVFKKKIRELDRGKALIFDESFRGLSSKGALSKENKKIISLLQECRQRNLFIFIVLPSIFVLETYVAIFRSQALIHAFCSKKNINRRYYKIYNYGNKKLLYLIGKKMMSYSRPKIKKTYRFYAKFPPSIDKKEYEAKKLAAFREDEDKIPEESKYIKQRNELIIYYHKKFKETQETIAKVIGKSGFPMGRSQISRILGVRPPKT